MIAGMWGEIGVGIEGVDGEGRFGGQQRGGFRSGGHGGFSILILNDLAISTKPKL